jgi:hypothetical protein
LDVFLGKKDDDYGNAIGFEKNAETHLGGVEAQFY